MDIISKCSIHGNLTKDEVYTYRIKRFSKFKGEYHTFANYCKKCKYFHSNRYIKNNPEKHKEWRYKYNQKEHPTAVRRRRLLKKYGMTIDQYDLLLKKQNNLCAICHKKETYVDRRINTIKRLSIDHCHKTGVNRGLLCQHCNIMIGHANDDIKILQSAQDYLLRHKK